MTPTPALATPVTAIVIWLLVSKKLKLRTLLTLASFGLIVFCVVAMWNGALDGPGVPGKGFWPHFANWLAFNGTAPNGDTFPVGNGQTALTAGFFAAIVILGIRWLCIPSSIAKAKGATEKEQWAVIGAMIAGSFFTPVIGWLAGYAVATALPDRRKQGSAKSGNNNQARHPNT